MELKASSDIENSGSARRIEHEFWPLDAIDPKKAKFPCCLVWTPLPVVSWLAPFIGHVGNCRENGGVIEFSGSNFVNVDDFAFGPVARYLELCREQCCFPTNLSTHKCKNGYKHAEHGFAIAWDDALHSSMRYFENKSYNMFTCNCHSFVAKPHVLSWINGLEYDERSNHDTFEGPLGQCTIRIKIIPALCGGALRRYSGLWLAILSWVVVLFPPFDGMVSGWHLFAEKSTRMLNIIPLF